jgi:hypothetical protein
MNAALKGLNNRVAPSGLTKEKGRLFPRALPWAILFSPFRAIKSLRDAVSKIRLSNNKLRGLREYSTLNPSP